MNNFAVLTIAYSHTATSIIINITTNNPCHLTCYYTDKEPGSHRTARNQRGLTLPWGVYYCFVAWLSVEQAQAGDTLTHTFEIPAWSYCQIKWFAFRGTVAGELSPSVSPIFQHHHPGVITTTNRTVWQKAYYQVAKSARPGDPDEIYNLVHDQELADTYWDGIMIYGQRVRAFSDYAYAMIRRTAIIFFTRILPPCTLLHAVLRLDMRRTGPPSGYTANWDWFVKVRAGHDLNAEITHKDLANYSKILALGTEIGSKYADDLPPYGYQDYWYIDVPLEFINLDGFTAITSLVSKDETRTRPASNTVEEALFIANSFTRLQLAYGKY